MKVSHMKKLDAHYMRYFRVMDPDKEVTVIHPVQDNGKPHVDVYVCKANEKRPYQILATFGASEYAMPGKIYGNLTNRNEYVTFAPADWDFDDPKYSWLVQWLLITAHYTDMTGEGITYSHTLDFSTVVEENVDDDFNMAAVQLMFPQKLDVSVLRAKLGLFRTATVLHMMPITAEELHTVREGGQLEAVIDRIYDSKAEKFAFLSARKR